MAQPTVANLKDSVAAMLSGVDLNNVDDLNGAFERAARTLVQKAKIPETQGTQNIMLYSGITDYTINTSIFGTNVIDIRPQGISRNPSNFVFKKFGDDFDRLKGFQRLGTMCTFDYSNGTPIIRIVTSQTFPQNILDPMTATTGWVAAGSASGLTQDSAVYYQIPASLRFTLTGSSTGTLTKTLTNASNLSLLQGVGVSFLALRLPDGSTSTNLTSVTLKLGSSASAYSSVTATTGFLAAWGAGNWLLVPFDFSTTTDTGTPNWAAINYVQLSFAHTGTFTNIRVGDLFISQPSAYQILYGSAGFFRIGTTVSTSITAVTDEIILNDSAYTIYQYECALNVLQQTSGGSGDAMTARIESILNGARARNGMVVALGLYDLYRGDNPSAVLKTVGNYYEDDTGTGYIGRGGFY